MAVCEHLIVMSLTDLYGRALGRECLDCGERLADQPEPVSGKHEQDRQANVRHLWHRHPLREPATANIPARKVARL